MGFNNLGVEYLADQLKNFSRPNGLVIGGNIGKNKDTPNENAVDDYLFCFETLYSYVDYFVVNVSSPNTPGLRSLQEKEPLTHLLASLQRANTAKTIPKPILLKIAPDVSRGQIDDILEVISLTGCSGLVIANTTSGRDSLITDTRKVELFGAGGISGQPLKEKSNELISYVYEKTKGAIPIVGVGGVASVADALEKLKAGASLIQIYTGLVYEGPFLVRDLVDGTSS
jgi:dihydroorotate dehydrogenase